MDSLFKQTFRGFMVRFTEEDHEAIKKLASENERSFNKQVIRLCRFALKYLADREVLPKSQIPLKGTGKKAKR